jgi:hypothetical protein
MVAGPPDQRYGGQSPRQTNLLNQSDPRSASLTPADAQATSNSIAIEIDGNQRDVIRLCAGAKDLPSADWSVFL